MLDELKFLKLHVFTFFLTCYLRNDKSYKDIISIISGYNMKDRLKIYMA